MTARGSLSRVSVAAPPSAATDTASKAYLDAATDPGLLVPATRAVTAGTGLTGGGTLAADRALAVAYGTTAGTSVQGNDSRLSDSRTPTGHASTHRSGGADPVMPAPRPVTGAATTTITAVTGVDVDRVDVTTTVSITSLVLSGGFNGQQVRIVVLASGATRTVTVASAVDISTGLSRGPYSIGSGQLGKFLVEYSTLNAKWALLAATVTAV